MATQKIDRGPTAVTVSRNVKRLMKARGWSYEDLSRALGEIGRPVLATGLVKVINGTRRVDVDELVALSIALQVNPSTLLLPASTGQDETYDLTGASGIPAHQAWDWADGQAPLFNPDGDESDLDFQLYARPAGRRTYRNLPGRRFAELDNADTRRQAWNRLWPEGFDWSQSRGVQPEPDDEGRQ